MKHIHSIGAFGLPSDILKYSKRHIHQFPLSIDGTNNNPFVQINQYQHKFLSHNFPSISRALERKILAFSINSLGTTSSLLFQYRETMHNPSTIFPAIIPDISVPDVPEDRKMSPPTWSKETANWPARRNLINGSGAIKIERATPSPPSPDGARLLTRNSRAFPASLPSSSSLNVSNCSPVCR